MKIKAIKCLTCGDIIYSMARWDFRRCGCMSVAVDGGFDYCKISAKDPSKIKFVDIEVNANKEELYRDWNSGRNKYGLIRKREQNG